MLALGMHLENDFEYSFKFMKAKGNFNKLWQMKSIARQSLKEWLMVADMSPKMSEICANACSELIENCIKYSKNSSIAAVSIKAKDENVVVETINTAEKVQKDTIIESIDKLNAASDPKYLFAESLLNPVEGKSQLGLMKILMETKGIIELIQEPDEEVVHVKLIMKAGAYASS